jgi:PAS domain S-box-containing protein
MTLGFLLLLNNALLLFALVFIYGLVQKWLRRLPSAVLPWVNGTVFGFFAVLNMLIPTVIMPGVVFDLRSPIIAVSTLFYGPITGFVAALIIAAFRLWTGGAGAPAGAFGSITAALLLSFAYWWLQRKQQPISVWVLLGFGFIITGNSLVYLSLLIPSTSEVFFPTILTTLIAFPAATLLFGILILDQNYQLRLEAELRESEQRFRSIFNTVYQFIGLCKPDGTLIEANDTALIFGGLNASDVIGKPFWEASWWTLSIETQDQLKAAIKSAASGEFVRYDVDVLGAGGRVITIDFSLKPINDTNGKIALLIPEGRDITEMKKAEKQALELAAEHERTTMLERFIHDVAHDLRTPVSIILTKTALLRRSTDPQEQQEHLIRLAQQAARVVNLLNDTLSLARLDQNLPAVGYQTFDITPLLRDLYEEFLPLATINQQVLDSQFTVSSASVYADKSDLRRAIANIMLNALNYTLQGGNITLSTRQSDSNIVIEVQDNGIGISREDLQHVFERFYRVDKARSVETGGTGLGLSIAQKVIKQYGGDITLQSEAGNGTRATIILPLVKTSA